MSDLKFILTDLVAALDLIVRTDETPINDKRWAPREIATDHLMLWTGDQWKIGMPAHEVAALIVSGDSKA